MGNKCHGDGTIGKVCQSVMKSPIAAANKTACGPVDVGFATACDVVFGGPEDPVGDVTCTAATAAAVTACELGVEKAEEYADPKHHAHDIAKDVCKKAFCNS